MAERQSVQLAALSTVVRRAARDDVEFVAAVDVGGLHYSGRWRRPLPRSFI